MTLDTLATELPCTVTYIGYHAAGRPGDVAVIENGREITYGDFYRDIGRMTAALRRFGLGPGNVVGVEHPQFYLHWLAVLALEALGAASFSYEEAEADTLADALAAADLIIFYPGRKPLNARRSLAMDRDWIASVRGLEPESPVVTAPIGPDTPIRITKSSGTTGGLKQMIHTARVRAFWMTYFQFRVGINRASRFLVTMGFAIEGSHAYATACIRMGGACIHDDREGVAETLVKHAITHVALPPFQLMQVLDKIPEDHAMAPDLTVFTIGAPVSKAVRDRVRRLLATELIESYGTSETGGICDMGDDGVGRVLPGVRVEVVGDGGDAPLFGQPGEVRIRSEGCVAGYLDNPEATGRMFRDGWFYPGDLAVMTDRHTVRLVGRADDLLNIRGVKFAPGPLEEKLRAALPVDDLCLTALADGEDVARLWVVVVLRDGGGLPGIEEQLVPLLPAALGGVGVVAVKAIPRTGTGKVQRKALKIIMGT